ncbi:MAG: L-threonylcarbamoyladenylate synthase [Myxococcota bacterium]
MSIPIGRGPDAVRLAVERLKGGELVAMPTETVYGLAGDARSDDAVARVFAAKGRPRINPLIAHVHALELIREEVEITDAAGRLAARFWPGPLTMVLPRRATAHVSLLASAGLDSLAVRVPRHPVALELLREFGGPLVAPSANRSGEISPTRAEHVANEMGDSVRLVLDGGPCEVGIESTVVDLTATTPRLLRPGLIDRGMLESVLDKPVGDIPSNAADAPKSPGLVGRHYAPSKPMRLDASTVQPGEALLAFGSSVPGGAAVTRNLSPTSDPVEAAANLFAMLRELDQSEAHAIAVMPIPGPGLAEALRDRLTRAATPPSP